MTTSNTCNKGLGTHHFYLLADKIGNKKGQYAIILAFINDSYIVTC